jgi:tetratricopeptide (TPR) repeat protein
MKRTHLTAVLLLLIANVHAQVQMPAPSPTQTVTQQFGLGSIEVKYSRPVTKGRKVFGDLVPVNKLWRTGANAATTIRFTDAVEIRGKKIDSGTYALYSVPGIETWEIILNKGVNNWGVDGYRESQDVVRFKVEPFKMKQPLESFTIQFNDVKAESCELQLMWEKTSVTIPIQTNIKDRLRKQITAALQTDKQPWFEAAQFYNEYERNISKALEYAGKAVEANPKAFWIWLYKARIEKEAGKTAAAMASSQQSLALAREANNDDYVKMNVELQKTLK